MNTSVLCDRGQVTIPKQFRTRLGLTPKTVLVFRIVQNTLVVEKSKTPNPFEAAYGCFSQNVPEGTQTDDIIREIRGC